MVNQKLGIHYCDANLTQVKIKYESYRAKCKALTADEIKINSQKGCVIPKDGTPKKCQIDIIKSEAPDKLYNSKLVKCIIYSLVGLIIFCLGVIIGYHIYPRVT